MQLEVLVLMHHLQVIHTFLSHHSIVQLESCDRAACDAYLPSAQERKLKLFSRKTHELCKTVRTQGRQI